MNRRARRKFSLLGSMANISTPITKAENKANREKGIIPEVVRVKEKRDSTGRLYRTTEYVKRGGRIFTNTTWH